MGVCTESSNPDVVVMKSAKASSPLNRAEDRRILVQGSMRSDAVVIVRIGSQDSAQMHLAQDNDVVHTLTPDRSDQCVAAPKIDPPYCLT